MSYHFPGPRVISTSLIWADVPSVSWFHETVQLAAKLLVFSLLCISKRCLLTGCFQLEWIKGWLSCLDHQQSRCPVSPSSQHPLIVFPLRTDGLFVLCAPSYIPAGGQWMVGGSSGWGQDWELFAVCGCVHARRVILSLSCLISVQFSFCVCSTLIIKALSAVKWGHGCVQVWMALPFLTGNFASSLVTGLTRNLRGCLTHWTWLPV